MFFGLVKFLKLFLRKKINFPLGFDEVFLTEQVEIDWEKIMEKIEGELTREKENRGSPTKKVIKQLN